jgi:arylsulfatase A-like enzyme
MERHRRDAFILFVAFLEPHSPYNGPLNTEHRDDEVEFNATSTRKFGPDIPLRYRLRQEYMEANFGTTLDDYRPIKRNYFGLVTQIDRSIGAILGKLDSLGLANDTIVVHTSDHGDMMGDHRLFDKQVMFDPSARVPYLVRLPGQTRQHRVAQPVSQIDFVPTMIDLLGAPVHPQCTGRSRARLARGDSMPAETIFAQWSPNVGRERLLKGTSLAAPEAVARGIMESTRTAISPEGWKLNLRDTGEHELYPLTDDPLELRNVFGRAENRATTQRLRAEIESWQSRTADTLKLA